MIIAGLAAFFVAIITVLWIYSSKLEKEAGEACNKRFETTKDCIKWMEKWKDSELKMRELRKRLENAGILTFKYSDIYDEHGDFVKKTRSDVWNFRRGSK